MTHPTLQALANNTLHGQAELWLDPLGNEVETSDCSLTILETGFDYTWAYQGKSQKGHLDLCEGGAEWTDTWHQEKPMVCKAVAASPSIVDVLGSYSAGEGPDWGWRITLSQRPSGEIVLQMTNITPWGERGRAVRMVATP